MLVTRVVTCAGGRCNVFLVERVTVTLTTHHSMAVLSEREICNWLDTVVERCYNRGDLCSQDTAGRCPPHRFLEDN